MTRRAAPSANLKVIALHTLPLHRPGELIPQMTLAGIRRYVPARAFLGIDEEMNMVVVASGLSG